jgi:hypothetical protein
MAGKIEPVRTFELDGARYLWEQRHGVHVPSTLEHSGKGMKGISFLIRLEPGKWRELILDFEFGYFADRLPSPGKIEHAFKTAIPAAIEAGWDPESRGKAFRHTIMVDRSGEEADEDEDD